MNLRKRRAKGIDMVGHHDQMNVIGHQDPTPHCNAVGRAMGCKQIAISGVVRVGEKCLLPPVSTLRDVMGNSRNNKSGQPCHLQSVPSPNAGRQFSALSP